MNGAVKLWSNLTVPLAPDMNVTFSKSAAPNSRLLLPDEANDPVPVTAVLMMTFEPLMIVNASDPVITPLNVAVAPFWMLMAPDPLMLPKKVELVFLPEMAIDRYQRSHSRDRYSLLRSAMRLQRRWK